MDLHQALMIFSTAILSAGAVWAIARIGGDKQQRFTVVAMLAAGITTAEFANSYFHLSGWKHYATLGGIILLFALIEQRLFAAKGRA